jgi:hypothetical protein
MLRARHRAALRCAAMRWRRRHWVRMNKVVSEDALRRALDGIDEAASEGWMRPSPQHCLREALDRPWVLDIDASIRPLYGRQEGAQIGYNPAKPMRPSHVLHTIPVSKLRLVLDVQVSSGKQHTSGHAKAALGRLLDELGDKRQALVRGDSGHGNAGILLTLEERKQPRLLRLRQTKNVQRLVAQPFAREDWSRPDNQGCQTVQAQLQLQGWSRRRRVVIVRQRIRWGCLLRYIATGSRLSSGHHRRRRGNCRIWVHSRSTRAGRSHSHENSNASRQHHRGRVGGHAHRRCDQHLEHRQIGELPAHGACRPHGAGGAAGGACPGRGE